MRLDDYGKPSALERATSPAVWRLHKLDDPRLHTNGRSRLDAVLVDGIERGVGPNQCHE